MTAPTTLARPLVVRTIYVGRLRARYALIEGTEYASSRRTTPYGDVLHVIHPGQSVLVRLRRGALDVGDRLSMAELVRSVRSPSEIPWRWVERWP